MAVKEERLTAIMGEGGITSCGSSQNCVQVCPKGIPLPTSIAHLNRQTTVQSYKKFFLEVFRVEKSSVQLYL